MGRRGCAAGAGTPGRPTALGGRPRARRRGRRFRASSVRRRALRRTESTAAVMGDREAGVRRNSTPQARRAARTGGRTSGRRRASSSQPVRQGASRRAAGTRGPRSFPAPPRSPVARALEGRAQRFAPGDVAGGKAHLREYDHRVASLRKTRERRDLSSRSAGGSRRATIPPCADLPTSRRRRGCIDSARGRRARRERGREDEAKLAGVRDLAVQRDRHRAPSTLWFQAARGTGSRRPPPKGWPRARRGLRRLRAVPFP